jgi:hypothetical protein
MDPLRHTEPVPDYCTCGAELPPDARFCHKCGKPQRDEPVLVEESEPESQPEQMPTPAAAPVHLPTDITFRNSVAVRVGFVGAALASVLTLGFGPLSLVWIVAAGFFAVFLYKRRTGQFVSIRGGAQIGWITGVFSALISTVLFTLVISSVGQAQYVEEYRKKLSDWGVDRAIVDQTTHWLATPGGFITSIVVALILQFIAFSSLSALGGALGARIFRKH